LEKISISFYNKRAKNNRLTTIKTKQ